MASEHDETTTLASADKDGSLRVPSLVVTVTTKEGAVLEAPLALRPVVVGTSAECDLVVADPRVSRRHCELSLGPGGVTLRDLGSKNGTLLGKASIREALIPPEQVVTIGGSSLVVKPKGTISKVPMSASRSFGGAIGQSFVMRALFARLERAAATDETILLLGESGTGKEVLARAIHERSPRSGGPFVVFDCGAISPSLVESEIFGYARGAFTGASGARAGLMEEASGGTLFLDEIGELPIDLQPKLLRALEAKQIRRLGANDYKPFDARVVVATHRDLEAKVADGSFRQDLYYRLAVVEAHVPALRARKDDLPMLVELFLSAHTPPLSLDDLPPRALDLLTAYDWPGNVRELRNVVARLVLFPDMLDEALGAQARRGHEAQEGLPNKVEEALDPLIGMPLLTAREVVMERFERRYLTAKLNEHEGNISRAADAMGVSRQLVHRLLERYGMRAKG